MDTFADQSTLFGDKPVVINNLNIPKPAPGERALLMFDEVTTMFHEFGHGLHGLFSAVKYPLLSGASVPPDFGEYPSQFNEMWAREPVVLAHFARHDKTGGDRHTATGRREGPEARGVDEVSGGGDLGALWTPSHWSLTEKIVRPSWRVGRTAI